VIGRPLPDVNVYLVDRHGHPVPVRTHPAAVGSR